jgi:hypothetical protein
MGAIMLLKNESGYQRSWRNAIKVGEAISNSVAPATIFLRQVLARLGGEATELEMASPTLICSWLTGQIPKLFFESA